MQGNYTQPNVLKIICFFTICSKQILQVPLLHKIEKLELEIKHFQDQVKRTRQGKFGEKALAPSGS